MKNVQRLRSLWDYLPAFRAVAESEHLPTASRMLAVSPPALSRSIHLLEERLGHSLFERIGARLRLNPSGQTFLASLRVAMRTLDDGVAEVLDGAAHPSGDVGVAFPPEAGPLVARWIAELAARAPHLILRQRAPTTSTAIALRRGAIDFALASIPPEDGTLETFAAGPLRWKLWRGRGSRRIAPPWPVIATPTTPWPDGLARSVVAELAELHAVASAVAERRGVVALLPEGHAAAHGLIAVGRTIATTNLHVIYRKPVGAHARTEVALAALRSAIARSR